MEVHLMHMFPFLTKTTSEKGAFNLQAMMFIFMLASHLMAQSENVPNMDDIDISIEENQEERIPSSKSKDVSLIVEVEGSPNKHKEYIETYYPAIEVVATYDTLFYGIALKGSPERISKVADLNFVKGIHPVQTYSTLETRSKRLFNAPSDFMESNVFVPSDLNNTAYTGNGVKIGVVDTGIDFTHPDLSSNYQGGYDLVDLDDEPMETTEEEGLPTNHGTHVSGIAAANGNLQGVAPDGEIYAYRALGPGGFGTSIQVIAAMEEAVNDGVDVMNLSLGNTVNGPDYPTSKAVNEAAKKGVAVVVANGNAGPTNWTVGAPATAAAALSVGAYQPSGLAPYLYEPASGKKIKLSPLSFSKPWDFSKDYEIAHFKEETDLNGKIGMIKQENKPVADDLSALEEAGAVAAILYDIRPDNQEWMVGLKEANLDIPIAIISTKDGRWIEKQIKDDVVFFKNRQETTDSTIAGFSSRGPVTVNWMMKPDVIAPGVNILSTVPGGYDILNGTSMAAPHVAGAIALIKEAKPNWSNEQIFGAIKTTAKQIHQEEGNEVEPIMQGAGLIDIAAAIETETIIKEPLLSFGKYGYHIDERIIDLEVENLSEEPKHFAFDVPKKEKGLSWNLPQSFTVEPGETTEVPLELKVNTLELEQGTYQGWLKLHSGKKIFSLPYLFISETSDYPKIMGFSFQLDKLDQDLYQYQMYVAEPVRSVQIQLYDPTSLVYKGELVKWTDLEVGMNEGEIKRRHVTHRGNFHGLIVVQLEDGEYVNYETEIILE